MPVIDTYAIALTLDPSGVAGKTSSIKRSLSTLDRSVQPLDDRSIRQSVSLLNRSFDRLRIKARAIGRTLSTGLARIRLPATIVAGGGLFLGSKLINEASTAQEAINAVNVTFEDFSKTITDFAKTAPRAVGLTGTQFNTIATKLRPLLKNAGFAGEELNKELIRLVKRGADVASIYDKEVNDVLDNFASALVGESEPVKKFGILLGQSSLQAQALADGMEGSVTKMTEQQKSAIRLNAILKQTDKTQGDFIRTSKEFANAQKILAAELATTREELGTRLLPLGTRILTIFSKLSEAFRNLSPEAKDLLVKVGIGITAVAGALALLAIAVPVIAALGPAFALLANPIGLVIAAVAGLVIYFREDLVNAFKKAGEIAKEVFNGLGQLWDSLKIKAQEVFNGLGQLWDSLKTKAQEVWGAITGYIFNALDKLRDFLGLNKTVSEEARAAGQSGQRFGTSDLARRQQLRQQQRQQQLQNSGTVNNTSTSLRQQNSINANINVEGSNLGRDEVYAGVYDGMTDALYDLPGLT